MLIDQRKLKLLVSSAAVATMSALRYILKLFVLASWQGCYSPIDPKINPHLRLNMAHSDVD